MAKSSCEAAVNLLLRMAGSRSLTSFVHTLHEGFVLNCEEGGGVVVCCVCASPVGRDHLGGGNLDRAYCTILGWFAC